MRTWFSKLPMAVVATAALSLAACGSDTSTNTAATPNDTSATDSNTVKDSTGTDGADTSTTGDVKTDAKTDVKADTTKDTAKPEDPDGKIDGAVEMTLDDQSGAFVGQDTLDPTGDVDYWSFTGKKGQLIDLMIQSNQQNSPFDSDTIDTFITLYGPDKKQIGLNDDQPSFQNNDSEILTVLPADGTYYVRVEECWTWIGLHPTGGGTCIDPEEKGNVDYVVAAFILDPAKQTNINPEIAEPNDTTATKVGYQMGEQYYLNTVLYGSLSSATDVDIYQFTPPLDANVSDGRATCRIDAGFPGVNGNGSTLDGLVASIASESTPTVVLAQADLYKGAIQLPCTLGAGYIMTVKRIANSKTSTADFYVITHGVGGSNPLEKAESANDTAAGAEVLTASKTSQGLDAYYFAGDLINGAKDVDYFSVKVPTGAKNLSVYCAALTYGSGLVGFTAEVKTDADATIQGGTAVEDATKGLALKTLAVPTGATKLLVKVSAKSQDPVVTGNYYLCGVPFATK
ncbi:MAG: PPC domain-containing protein [Deltaproteobacteria bacterium]|nr:PPC domain-containing protein [Deltaproteobacteria bacterium]